MKASDLEKAQYGLASCNTCDHSYILRSEAIAAYAEDLAAERASLPESVERELEDACQCVGGSGVKCFPCRALEDLRKWKAGEL